MESRVCEAPMQARESLDPVSPILPNPSTALLLKSKHAGGEAKEAAATTTTLDDAIGFE